MKNFIILQTWVKINSKVVIFIIENNTNAKKTFD